jgi:hypothetical protein
MQQILDTLKSVHLGDIAFDVYSSKAIPNEATWFCLTNVCSVCQKPACSCRHDLPFSVDSKFITRGQRDAKDESRMVWVVAPQRLLLLVNVIAAKKHAIHCADRSSTSVLCHHRS